MAAAINRYAIMIVQPNGSNREFSSRYCQPLSLLQLAANLENIAAQIRLQARMPSSPLAALAASAANAK